MCKACCALSGYWVLVLLTLRIGLVRSLWGAFEQTVYDCEYDLDEAACLMCAGHALDLIGGRYRRPAYTTLRACCRHDGYEYFMKSSLANYVPGHLTSYFFPRHDMIFWMGPSHRSALPRRGVAFGVRITRWTLRVARSFRLRRRRHRGRQVRRRRRGVLPGAQVRRRATRPSRHLLFRRHLFRRRVHRRHQGHCRPVGTLAMRHTSTVPSRAPSIPTVRSTPTLPNWSTCSMATFASRGAHCRAGAATAPPSSRTPTRHNRQTRRS